MRGQYSFYSIEVALNISSRMQHIICVMQVHFLWQVHLRANSTQGILGRLYRSMFRITNDLTQLQQSVFRSGWDGMLAELQIVQRRVLQNFDASKMGKCCVPRDNICTCSRRCCERLNRISPSWGDGLGATIILRRKCIG